jgi:hypothetical protein
MQEGEGNAVTEQISGRSQAIHGNFRWVDPAGGAGLKMDGFTTFIDIPAAETPRLDEAFSISAWVAPQTYPWNWVAFADQHRGPESGFLFGMDAEGHLGIQLSVGGVWTAFISHESIPLMRWTHVAATVDAVSGVKLYMNGGEVAETPLSGRFHQASGVPLRIGRNLRDLPATALVRPKAAYPALYSYDGIMCDLRLSASVLSAAELRTLSSDPRGSEKPDLHTRSWPAMTSRSTTLQAAYTSLSLYPEWDALWRSGPAADVVVTLPDSPVHYVFWRGANYGPSMVTENGLWFGDQSFEASTEVGTAEHMNDKHNAHSSIRIEENTPARVVLRWRYGLVDVLGNFAGIDPNTGWGDWADEWFYIYPDGTAVRHSVVHGVRKKFSLTEPTLLLAPGQKPEDLLEPDAASVLNASGERKSYSWKVAPPAYPFADQPRDANIAVVNSKSMFKPFYIYRLGMELGPYGWPPEVRMEYSHFPVWDHWPVNQIPSDGRFQLIPDDFASAAIMSPNPKATWTELAEGKANTFLFGLTRNADELALLDRSWLRPPSIQVAPNTLWHPVFDFDQKAYIFTCSHCDAKAKSLKFTIRASDASPIVNPAFVLENWPGTNPVVQINGKIAGPNEVIFGRVEQLDGVRLVVWMRRQSVKDLHISFRPR